MFSSTVDSEEETVRKSVAVLPHRACSHSAHISLFLGSEFIAKLAETYVKNTSAALSAVSAKLSEIAADGKVSLAQATEAFESLEVGNGPEPLVGICGGDGTCQPRPTIWWINRV
jgi:hypothetical protein